MRDATRISAAAFGALGALLLAAAATVSWLTAQGASSLLRLPFRLLCHGIEERSFELFGTAMPLCARCTGLYAGLLAGVVVFVLLSQATKVHMSGSVAAVLVLPLAVDGSLQAAGFYESVNQVRFITGVVAALPGIVWVLSTIERGAVPAAEAPGSVTDS
jgi:uncharacterized membrane protein